MADFDVFDSYPVRRAAGGVVLREENGKQEIAVVYRNKQRDWALPKGKVDPSDQSLEIAALREVFEETSLHCHIERLLCAPTYKSQTGHPRTFYCWLMTWVAGVIEPGLKEEIGAAKWVSLGEAVKLLTSDRDRVIIFTLMLELQND